jgi:hypothetical protein
MTMTTIPGICEICGSPTAKPGGYRCWKHLQDRKPIRVMPKHGRNSPCPCGSGLKFKKCCLPRLESGQGIQRPIPEEIDQKSAGNPAGNPPPEASERISEGQFSSPEAPKAPSYPDSPPEPAERPTSKADINDPRCEQREVSWAKAPKLPGRLLTNCPFCSAYITANPGALARIGRSCLCGALLNRSMAFRIKEG